MAPDIVANAVELPPVFALLLFCAVTLKPFYWNTVRYFRIYYYEFDPLTFKSGDHIHLIC